MSLSVCPVAVIHAPPDRVWALLSTPSSFDSWWDVKTDAIVPPGPAQPGQVITAHGRALGRDRHLTIRVVAVDEERRRLQLVSSFPFGISLDNDIRVGTVDSRTARVSFG